MIVPAYIPDFPHRLLRVFGPVPFQRHRRTVFKQPKIALAEPLLPAVKLRPADTETATRSAVPFPKTVQTGGSSRKP
jgi:hypothetical protein